MSKFTIFSDRYKDPQAEKARALSGHLHLAGAQSRIQPFDAKFEWRDVEKLDLDLESCDALIVLGGDGSFLRIARLAYEFEIPILGINLGRLGFLLDTDYDYFIDHVDDFLSGAWIKEFRQMLACEVYDSKRNLLWHDVALNDVVISSSQGSRFTSLRLGIDGKYLQTIHGDGLIVASPSGSTGYALAAGGPIIFPHLNLLEITAICPHSLQGRTYIVSESNRVEIELDNYQIDQQRIALYVDGHPRHSLQAEERVEVTAARRQLEILSSPQAAPYSDLDAKLRARR
ncbi:MAG: NAD(+)/NADH kinase [Eubacteriales bacterium]|nr:NAD(+)/NADH kinase [Eubacteriales bacterium]